jgi:protein required for attachment to host cells
MRGANRSLIFVKVKFAGRKCCRDVGAVDINQREDRRCSDIYSTSGTGIAMVKKAQKIWVIVSDGVHAQVYVITNVRPLRIEALSSGHFQGRKLAQPHTDHAGTARHFDADGGARHPVTRHTDPHRIDKEVFAEHLAEFINDAGRQNLFNRLVLVAPDRALGDLRRELDQDVQNKIKIEVDGEWTKLSRANLEKHLADHVAQARADS